MEFIKSNININFVGFRYKALVISALIILVGFASTIWRGGLNMGVDFAGGTLIQVKFNKQTNPDAIRKALEGLIAQSSVQRIGSEGENEFLIRTEAVQEELASLSTRIEEELGKAYGPGQTVRRVEMVGPKVGHDLRQKALYAIFYSLLLIAIYISGRFEFQWINSLIMGGVLIVGVYLLEAIGLDPLILVIAALLVTLFLCYVLKLPYALGALLSLVHDILIVVGIFALFNKEFTLEILAALLTLAGYSLNDTIVVYDRIREIRGKDRKLRFDEMINSAINQTLSRTLLTGLTAFFIILCLFLFGGTVIHDFSFAMLIGLIVGTYSSIFVASSILIFYEKIPKGKSRKPVKRQAAATSRS